MSDHEPTPLDRTYLLEIALNTYQPGLPNLSEINQLDHHTAKIASELGEDPDVSARLKELRGCIAKLKYARDKKVPKDEQAALESARTANAALKNIIAGKGRE